MRFKALLAALVGFFMVGAAAAQTALLPPPLDPENTLLLDLSTGGRVSIQLRPDLAPGHVERIKMLARRGFYDGLTFHRVIEGFMAQGGDPEGDGTGGSELPDLKAEFNGLPHVRGALAAARTNEPDTANSQFYIMLAPRLSLDGKYTVFGRVVSGMNFVDGLSRGEPPVEPSTILKASIAADNVPPPPPGAAAPKPLVTELPPGPGAAAPAAASETGSVIDEVLDAVAEAADAALDKEGGNGAADEPDGAQPQ